MILRVGRFYRNRQNHKVGPIDAFPVEPGCPKKSFPFFFRDELGRIYSFRENGCYYGEHREDPLDLLEEWQEPINTTPIDLVTLNQYRRGIERVMPSLSNSGGRW